MDDGVCRRIAGRLSEEALLEQIVEECGEFVQQCAKRLRILRGENYTPVGLIENYELLTEELSDVLLVASVLEIKLGISDKMVLENCVKKLMRWSGRLGLDIDDYLRE